MLTFATNLKQIALKQIIYFSTLMLAMMSIACQNDKNGNGKGDEDEDDISNYYIHETGLQTDLYPINDTDGKLSYINQKGDIVLTTDYTFLSTSFFYNNRAQVSYNRALSTVHVDRDSVVGHISIEGIYDKTPYYGIYYADNDELHYQYFNYDNEVLTDYDYGDVIIEPYYEIQTWYAYRYGAIDTSGNEIIEAKYMAMGRYSKSQMIYTGDSFQEYRYHDFNGKIVRVDGKEKTYKSGTNFKTGYAVTQNFNDSIFIIVNEHFQVTDTIRNYYNSQWNGNGSWSEINEFCEMLCRIEHYEYDAELEYSTPKYGFANTYGRIIVPVNLGYAMDFYNGYSLFEKNGRWGFLNTNGEAAIANQYDDAHPFIEDVTTVKEQGGEWKFINRKGEEISETRFKSTGITSSGLTAFIPSDSTDDLYGFVNNKGEVVIEPQFYSSSFFNDRVVDAAFWGELALVEIDEVYSAYINKAGETVWQGETGHNDPIVSSNTPKGTRVKAQQFKERTAKMLKFLQ